ncbi:MAG: hypothetical protein ACYDDP_05965 [Acidithiobacillus sp.]
MTDKIGQNTRGRAGLGRPKGSSNVVTRTLKEALQASFDELGGVEWLVRLGRDEPKTFAMLLAKLLPPTASEGDEEMVIRIIGGFTEADD